MPSNPTDPVRLSRGKLAVFWAILLAIVLLPLPLAIVGYYAYARLTFPAYSCGSFAKLDSQIGWVLAPNAQSCIGGRRPFSQDPPWFEATVFTDMNGFRAASAGEETARGGIMAIGDSWTFGYGVAFEQSYPGILADILGERVVVAASPAYSATQSLLLAERWIGRLKPKALVYLDMGMWERGACRGVSKPTAILKPCYWQRDGTMQAELVFPPPGRIENLGRWGITPGGMVGAGEITWSYFLMARPYALVNGLLVRAGLIAGMANDFFAVAVDPGVIRTETFRHLLRVVEKADVPFILLDPYDLWTGLSAGLPPETARRVRRIGKAAWQAAVDTPASALPAHERQVPNDGHFGVGANRLVAALIARALAEADAH